jgi:DNA-binding transcriptional LysR family regulator
MNLRFIEAFVWVARLRSFTGAADKLCTTQAAISARIATLESDFGVKLFERDSRMVTLTPAGEEMLKHAEQLLGVSARMLDAVSSRNTPASLVTVGVIEVIVHTWLPDLLQRLKGRFPKARVEIQSNTTFQLHEELLKGNLELVLSAERLSNAAFLNTTVGEFEMAWIAAPVAPGAASVSTAERLNDVPVLTFLRDSYVYRDVVAKLGPSCITRINSISSIAAMLSLARIGYGVATLPLAAIRSALDDGQVESLTGIPPLSALPVIASRRLRSESPLVEVLAQLAADAARAFADAG